ncbi:class I SAM-dependent methyltransferase [Blastococcus brunescens]|uniref:Class I SAM-dependent methyltransferase n=1 Tax=Blastococcus brunescens TaxID=1564165 RepID=A0ABZ1AY36_9ACTN|nr:class I SAM-dependent methyltransferase [Blastococcus sp. BMG 8361]WRL63374.1 class I SAM-dependent methyltransferase [Blastococcus sp. BMG 8361]
MLVDLACGGGLMGPHVARLGYRHVGVDIGVRGLELARAHGVAPVRGSVLAVPLADGCADVVLAGEILEHVEDDVGVLAECARLLKPGAPWCSTPSRPAGCRRWSTCTCSSGCPGAAARTARPRPLRRPGAPARRGRPAGPRPAAGRAAAVDPGGDRVEARPPPHGPDEADPLHRRGVRGVRAQALKRRTHCVPRTFGA